MARMAYGQMKPAGPPTHQVIQMRQQGIPNDQIVQNLQREGYQTHQILDAMNQADIKRGVEGYLPKEGDNMAEEYPNDGQEAPAGYPPGVPQGPPGGMPPQPPGQEGYGGPPQMGMGQEGGYGYQEYPSERMEEVAESIIDEKWTDLIENVKRIVEWKEKTEARIAVMEENSKNLKADFDKLHASLLDRVGEYDKHISDVGTEIKALEKVFQKVLPSFVENITELSSITKSLRGAQIKPKDMGGPRRIVRIEK